jgi:tetratricopeptide (TPR) repeat protein
LLRIDPDLSGRSVGRFQIKAMLGSGGMGQVFLADDPVLKRQVAIKTVSPRFYGDGDYRRRLLREAERASSLTHPNIAGIYDVIEEAEQVFLVMEFVDGTSLRTRLLMPMTIDDTLNIFTQCARGLASAHQARIAHGDIKPENIMVTQELTVKICDFGLARYTGERAANATTLRESEMAGTPAYMSPELLLGREAGPAADVFAMGVMLYEMLSGDNFFHAGSFAGTSDRILHNDPPSLRPARPGISDALEALVFRMLAKDPAARCADAVEVLDRLARLETAHDEPSRPKPSAASVPHVANLAILPFTAIGGGTELQSYCDGITETLNAMLARLAKDQSLQVASGAEVRARRVRNTEDARKQLGAGLVLMGTLQKAGGLLRLNYFLTETSSKQTVHADSIKADASDPFALQDRVFREVAGALGLIPIGGDAETGSFGTEKPGAYEFYLQARGYLRNHDRLENVERAIGLFSQSIQTDPRYAHAHAGLGEAYWKKYLLLKSAETIQPAREACQHALEIRPNLPEAHACLGMIYLGTGEYELAVEEYDRALQADPANDEFSGGLARAYEALNQLEHAEITYQRAIRLRPHYWGSYNNLGGYYYRSGKYDRAVEMFRHVVSLAPDGIRGFSNLGAAYFMQARTEEAIHAFEQSMALQPNYRAASNLGTLYFYEKHDFAAAADAYRKAITLNDRDYVVWANLGAALKWLGALDESQKAYESAIARAEESRRLNPRNATIVGALAEYNAAVGKEDRARELLQNALELKPNEPSLMLRAAVIYECHFKERETALAWLGRAVASGYSWNEIEKSPALSTLHADERFVELKDRTMQRPVNTTLTIPGEEHA